MRSFESLPRLNPRLSPTCMIQLYQSLRSLADKDIWSSGRWQAWTGRSTSRHSFLLSLFSQSLKVNSAGSRHHMGSSLWPIWYPMIYLSSRTKKTILHTPFKIIRSGAFQRCAGLGTCLFIHVSFFLQFDCVNGPWC